MSVYHRLPSLLQNLAVSLKGGLIRSRRYGCGFKEISEDVQGREWLSRNEIKFIQEQRVKCLIRSATNTPFWKTHFDRWGVDVKGADPLGEMAKLPILKKDVVKEKVSAFRSRRYSSDQLIDRHTSGTTGSGLKFWELRRTEQEQWAVWWRYRRWHGLDRKTWMGYFGGRRIVEMGRNRPPFWRFNLPGRQIFFSNYHISPEAAPSYARAIKRHQLSWLHGYPSAIALLARYALEKNLGPFEHVKIVTTGAENLLDSQRKTISKAFGCIVRQHYGLAEGVANISECPEGSLHVDEDFALVEFLPIEDSETAHHIIGTNLANPAFPLFRYDTGDVAHLKSGATCSCGRNGRVVESLHGRQEDYVVIPSGARIGRLDHIFKDLVAVREAQIYQPSPERVIFRVVRGPEYDERDTEARLIREARKRLGDAINIDIDYRERIPRTDRGKIRFVVSELESMQIDRT